MAATGNLNTAFRFGEFIADPALFQLLRGNEPLPVEPRAFKVLLYLLERPGQLITKEDLVREFWHDSFVTDNALTRVIAQLRKLLGDDARQPRFIETVPTQGYRFIGEVRTGEAAPVRLAPRPRRTWFWLTGVAFLAAMAGATLLLRRDLPPGPSAASLYRTPAQLTSSTGLDTTPSFSPDGSQIAYASDKSGRFEIYVRPVETAGREIAVTADGAQNVQPAWSPDGSRIAYYSLATGSLRVTPATGGQPRELAASGSEPRWSPDGRWVAYRRGPVYSLTQVDVFPPAGSTLWIVAADGGEPRPLTRPGEPPGAHGAHTWAADGRKIYFTAGGRQRSLWSVTPEGELAELPAAQRPYSGLAAHPDGSLIATTTLGESSPPGLWRLDLSHRPVRTEPLHITDMAVPLHPAVSRDGRQIAYALDTLSSNLWTFPVDPKSGRRIGELRPLTRESSDRTTFPQFSPDGSQVAYNMRRRGRLADVYLVSATGGEPRQITSGDPGEVMAQWLPDGKELVFSRTDRRSKRLVRLSLADGRETVLAEAPGAMFGFRLAPDGQRVVWNQVERFGMTLYTRTAGAPSRRLSPEGLSAAYAAWSRDSGTLALEILEENATRLALLHPDGGGLRTIAGAPGQHHWPHSWSPGDSRIAFATQRAGVWNLGWVSRDGRQELLWTENRSARSYSRYPEWSPRGDQVVFEWAESTGNLYVLTRSPANEKGETAQGRSR